MTGSQIAGVLERMNVSQPLILLTGSGTASLNDTLTEGVALVLHKPVTEAQLHAAISKVIVSGSEQPEEAPLATACA
jgi:FixJ family two-component response regulator